MVAILGPSVPTHMPKRPVRSDRTRILDQYKEKTPKDPTIREKFNTYRFADHKEKVIDLLRRVTRVSVETMKIIEQMRTTKN
jgi:predicted helicase